MSLPVVSRGRRIAQMARIIGQGSETRVHRKAPQSATPASFASNRAEILISGASIDARGLGIRGKERP